MAKIQLTLAGDLDAIAELAGLAIDLDAIVQEFLVGGAIENTVVSRTRKVNGELVLGSSSLGGLGGSGLGLKTSSSHHSTHIECACSFPTEEKGLERKQRHKRRAPDKDRYDGKENGGLGVSLLRHLLSKAVHRNPERTIAIVEGEEGRKEGVGRRKTKLTGSRARISRSSIPRSEAPETLNRGQISANSPTLSPSPPLLLVLVPIWRILART